jgi:hypothetical protein
MRVNVYDGATDQLISEGADLLDCFDTEAEPEAYDAAHAELSKIGRVWIGGGAAPLLRIVRTFDSAR